jgi:hypothetical protein
VTRRWPPSLRWSLPAILLVLGGAGIAVGYRIDVGHFARMAVEEGREDARLVAYRAPPARRRTGRRPRRGRRGARRP